MENQTITVSALKELARLGKASARREAGLFLVEGTKAVADTAGLFDTAMVLATEEWAERHPAEAARLHPVRVSARDLQRVSSMTTPQGVIAVCRIPRTELSIGAMAQGLTLALDTIQDPGNLGTIIRTADWMGVRHIIASAETADCYSPKVVQATMGSLARVSVHYCPSLADTLQQLSQAGSRIYATTLGGADLYRETISHNACVVIGNEGRGISEEVLATTQCRVTIPAYAPAGERCESLNAAVAAAIVMARFRQKNY